VTGSLAPDNQLFERARTSPSESSSHSSRLIIVRPHRQEQNERRPVTHLHRGSEHDCSRLDPGEERLVSRRVEERTQELILLGCDAHDARRIARQREIWTCLVGAQRTHDELVGTHAENDRSRTAAQSQAASDFVGTFGLDETVLDFFCAEARYYAACRRAYRGGWRRTREWRVGHEGPRSNLRWVRGRWRDRRLRGNGRL
jgi:hypothetical protein